jgi:NADH:ubiquinone oxidoreductase subunit C
MIKIAKKIEKLNADRLISITSIHNGEGNTLYYHLSYNGKKDIREFSIDVPKGEKVESLTSVFQNAVLLEAEVTELFGVYFDGNERSGKRLFQAEGNEENVRKNFVRKSCPGGTN